MKRTALRRIELRRHSVRDKPEEDLSPSGLRLAAEVGRAAGPFVHVVASPVRRAVQTAEAMGFPPERTDPVWGELPDEVVKEISWPAPFHRVGRAVQAGYAATRSADRLVAATLDLVERTPPGEASLVVTHGGFPELVLTRTFPDLDPRPWGGVLRCMEGVEILYHEKGPVRLGILRVPEERTRV